MARLDVSELLAAKTKSSSTLGSSRTSHNRRRAWIGERSHLHKATVPRCIIPSAIPVHVGVWRRDAIGADPIHVQAIRGAHQGQRLLLQHRILNWSGSRVGLSRESQRNDSLSRRGLSRNVGYYLRQGQRNIMVRGVRGRSNDGLRDRGLSRCRNRQHLP